MKKARLLTIDLTSKSYSYDSISLELIGGRGFVTEHYSELADENVVIIAPAKFSGYPHKAAGRYSIGYYAPLYNEFKCSTIRGLFGGAVADINLDIIAILGKLEDFGAVTIREDKVEFLSDTSTTEKGIPFIGIGESGVNLSTVATAFDETGRQFGQGGLGRVFGGKNLGKLSVISNAKKQSYSLPPEINCSTCGKQSSCGDVKIESAANKYFVDSHIFKKMSEYLNITEASQLESLAAELAQNSEAYKDYFSERDRIEPELKKDNEEMVLADCLGLCGFALSDYTLKPEERELISRITSLEQSAK